ncbi:MAG TPA: spore coat protein U domain-containing protein [Anaeromyxobacteraceae bacterium]|nr:spore coat protein U domain-containing protein [Anaeromyxobacteraceae bacterium]
MKRLATVAVAAVLLAAPRASLAAPATASFKVSAKVPGACTVTAQDIAISAYDPNAATAATATGNLTLTCTRGTVYSVALSTTSGWTMKDAGGNPLTYQIQQGGTGTPWNETSLVKGTAADKKPFTLPATLVVATGQDVPVGDYTDNVSVTVNF